ncbi:MAG: phosphate ABC transporter permease PstA [Ignavibacteriales bacterium]|nr:phosphate ABC transporter permease PstA [Ignavibacteriales bacterium]
MQRADNSGSSLRFYWRKAVSVTMYVLSGLSALVAIIPLVLIFYYTLSLGLSAINVDFFTQLPKPVGESGGGLANAIVGTLVLVGLGSCISLPVGIMAGIYLSEFGNNAFGMAVRFLTDVLNGVPSIVTGVVAYTMIVIPMGHFSAYAGGVALAILMIPTITRTTEEMLKIVPQSYREAALALGISHWKTSLRIVVRTALGGVITGIMLAVARAAGETAPLLFTALNNRFWHTSLDQPIASLTVFIYNYGVSPFDDWIAQAWAGALVLMLMILVLSVAVRVATRSRFEER